MDVRIVPIVRLPLVPIGLLALAAVAGCGGGGGGGATGTVPPLVTASPSSLALSPTPSADATATDPPASTPTTDVTGSPSTTAGGSLDPGRPQPEETVEVPGTPAAGDYSDAAVLAAARAYVAALDVGFRTGDARPFMTITSVVCDCRGLYLRRFNQQAKDRVVTTFRTEVTGARVTRRSAMDATVAVQTFTPTYAVMYPDGRRTEGAPGKASLDLDLRVEKTRWLIRVVR